MKLGIWCSWVALRVHRQGSLFVRVHLAHQQLVSRRADFLQESALMTKREARMNKVLKMQKNNRKAILLAYVALSCAFLEDIPMAVPYFPVRAVQTEMDSPGTFDNNALSTCKKGVVSVPQPCADAAPIDHGTDQSQLFLAVCGSQAEQVDGAEESARGGEEHCSQAGEDWLQQRWY